MRRMNVGPSWDEAISKMREFQVELEAREPLQCRRFVLRSGLCRLRTLPGVAGP